MIFQAGNGPSSETHGQSVGSGEKVGRKLSNTGERSPGYSASGSSCRFYVGGSSSFFTPTDVEVFYETTT